MAPTSRLFDAVILAAGLSSRMQGFKPLYPLGGKAALAHVTTLFREAGAREVVVVSGHNGDAVDAAALAAGARPVRNACFAHGMFSSVQTGVAALRPGADAFFLLPVDIPLVRPATVRALLDTWGNAACTVAHPVFLDKRGHPPLLSCALRPAIAAWEGNGGLRGLLDDWEARHPGSAIDVAVTDEGVAQDMDTEADYALLAQRWERRGVPSRLECAALLRLANTPPRAAIHGEAVARVAVALGQILNNLSTVPTLDVERIEYAALLHDVAKGDAHHEAAGAALLDRHGFSAISSVVAAHRDIPPHPDQPLDEADVVFMADKLVSGTAVVPVALRYGQVLARHGSDPVARAAIEGRLANALAMQLRMETSTGIPLITLAKRALEA